MSDVLKDLPIISNNNNDKIGPVLDAQNTSLDNVLRLLIKDKYTKDTFKGITGFQGIILRTIVDPTSFEYSQRNEVLQKQNNSVVDPVKYKVWIPGPLYSIFVQPKTFDETPQDKTLIDALPDFSTSNSIIGTLAPGDIVWVSFGNIDSFKDPVIQYSFSEIKNNSAGGAPNAVPKAGEVFKSGPLPFAGSPSGPAPSSLTGRADQGKFITPIIKSESCKNDVKKYEEVIDQFCVDTNNRYARTPTNTFCNIFCFDVCCAMAAKYPQYVLPSGEPVNLNGFNERKPGTFENNANNAFNWFLKYGKSYGWTLLSGGEEAQNEANKGHITIGVYKNVKVDPNTNREISAGSGHLVVIRPDTNQYDSKKGPFIAQAGARNVNKIYLMSIHGSAFRQGKYNFYSIKCD